MAVHFESEATENTCIILGCFLEMLLADNVRMDCMRLTCLILLAANGDIGPHRQHFSLQHSSKPSNEARPGHVFHGYPTNFPATNAVGASVAPRLPDGIDDLSSHNGSSNNPAIAASIPKTEDAEDKSSTLFSDLPEAKRRKFILVDDPDRNARVRVRVMLDNVDMSEIPDSYRKANSVYPRSYFPIQMQSPLGSLKASRFFDDDDPEGGSKDDGETTLGKTLVPVVMLEGQERQVPVPKLARAKRAKEVTMNDLGYRMSWSQSRVFAGRTVFLQRARKSLGYSLQLVAKSDANF